MNVHLIRIPVCQVVEVNPDGQDPEDGITLEMAKRLAERKAEFKVSTYKDIWKTIFPGDDDSIIPDPSEQALISFLYSLSNGTQLWMNYVSLASFTLT